MSGINYRTVNINVQKFDSSNNLVAQWQFDVTNRKIYVPYAMGYGMLDYLEQSIPVSIIDSSTSTGEYSYKLSIASTANTFTNDIYTDLSVTIGNSPNEVRVQEVELTQVSGNPGGAA